MSTRRNYNTPGHADELTFGCYRRVPFLSKDRSRQWLAEAIDAACDKHRFHLWAYVFMPEHVHLLVWPEQREYDIARLKHAIKAPVARKAIAYLKNGSPDLLSRITRPRGKRIERLFWQPGGGYDRNLDNPTTVRRAIDYIHLNPVHRGLVDKPEDWEWSSAGWYLKGEPGPCVVHPLNVEVG